MSTAKATILLLCYDPVLRLVMADVLGSKGYVVVATGDLGTAVDRLWDTPPDLLIIHPDLDGISGHDAALYLRTKSPGLRVLMVGGLLDDDRLRYREALQEFEVFPKPFKGSDLLARVEEVLATHPHYRHHTA